MSRIAKVARTAGANTLLVLGLGSAVYGQAPTEGVTSSRVLRAIAVRAPIPPYPEKSLLTHAEGVAVAELRVRPDGRVASVRVLEAPDQAIRESVATTLRKWQFEAHSGRVILTGKLTFYFRISPDGNGSVSDTAKDELEQNPKKIPL